MAYCQRGDLLVAVLVLVTRLRVADAQVGTCTGTGCSCIVNYDCCLQVTEGVSGALVGDAIIHPDVDLQEAAQYTFSLEEEAPFNISNEGQITTSRAIDRETEGDCFRLIVSFEKSSVEILLLFAVEIQDINDNPPMFSEDQFTAIIVPENQPTNSVIVRFEASDPDLGNNSEISYAIIDQPQPISFQIDAKTGNLTLKQPLDREDTPEFTITVQASGMGDTLRTSSVLVTITVEDVNDNAPTFTSENYTFFLMENLPVNSSAGFVIATDPDAGENGTVMYTLREPSENFRVDPSSGEITSLQSFDREETENFTILVSAIDLGTPQLSASAAAEVTVQIRDENDNLPIFDLEQTPSHFVIDSRIPVGSSIGQVVATDRDVGENSEVLYSLTPLDFFDIGNTSGQITVARVLPTQPTLFTLTVIAYNPGSPSQQTTLNITIDLEIEVIQETDSGGGHVIRATSVLAVVVIGLLVAAVLIVGVCTLLIQMKKRQLTRQQSSYESRKSGVSS